MTRPDRRRAQRIDQAYARIPDIRCQGLCAESCGPIAMSRVEWERICERLGYAPKGQSLSCPMLADARCTVYDIRPAICRLWGVADEMPCPWGCVPDRQLTRQLAYSVLDAIRRAGE